MKEYIIIDFEFDGLDIHNAELLEFCCFYIKDDEIVDELTENVIYELNFDDINARKKQGLQFNNINSQDDIEVHNANSISQKEVIGKFLLKLKGNFDDRKVPIMGWNHASDISILYKLFDRIRIDKDEVLDYHIVDIGSMFRPFYYKFFNDKFRFNLDNTHMNVIGTIKKEDFHVARNDCVAILDMYKWIKEKMKEIK